ncbi:conserved hypothetical protein [uncultured Paludibacter sp.]|nr:conserved hypothetical protein [uncultured Paludibacter sp.]
MSSTKSKLLITGLILIGINLQGSFIFGKNYYFDSQKGNDKNVGISPKKPFCSLKKIATLNVGAGDSILLKSGMVFYEKLYFSGKGTQKHPIVIGKYGGEKMPHIKGNGTEREMIHIYNSENIVMKDIEISNKTKKPLPHLTGVLIELYNYGTGKNIVLENLYVHDVNGSLYKGDGYIHKDVGAGQAILLRNLKGNEKDSVPSNFDGLTVQNCKIKDCTRNGIMMWGNWIRKYWKPNLHVIIRNNELDGVPGDGIVPVGCESPIVEYNVMKNGTDVLPPTEACDGIWPWSCDNALIQYNIVSDHKSKVDGYGFDSDYNCNNSLFQYNLSYNNDGGFLLLCNSGGWPTDFSIGNNNTVIRYNVSINDGIRNFIVPPKKEYFSPVIHITGDTKNSHIEHNIFYVMKKEYSFMDKRIICADNWNGYADSTFIENNYFYIEEPTLAFEATHTTNNFLKNNLYIGPLEIPQTGFKSYSGIFDKKMWYDSNDKNWNNLISFLKDKSVVINGKKVKVLDLIGY